MMRHSKRGSSSALIVMVLSMLAVFGVFTLLSSYVNLKFSQKSARWTQEYYAYDLEAERVRSVIDAFCREKTGQDRIAHIEDRVAARWPDAEIVRVGEALRISLFVGETGVQGINMTLEASAEPGAACGVTNWSQWQKGAESGASGSGLWSGK